MKKFLNKLTEAATLLARHNQQWSELNSDLRSETLIRQKFHQQLLLPAPTPRERTSCLCLQKTIRQAISSRVAPAARRCSSVVQAVICGWWVSTDDKAARSNLAFGHTCIWMLFNHCITAQKLQDKRKMQFNELQFWP